VVEHATTPEDAMSTVSRPPSVREVMNTSKRLR